MNSQESRIDLMMFATQNLNVYTDLSIPVWKKYCEHFGYEFFHYDQSYFDHLHLVWSKIKSVREHLYQVNPDYLLMVDADTIPTGFTLSVDSIIEKFMKGKKEILFQKDGSNRLKYLYFPHNITTAIRRRKIVLPNAGFILIRNTKASRAFFDKWLELAEVSSWASIPPRNQNVLNYEMLNQPNLNSLVGYVDTWVVNRYKGELCIHISSQSPEEVRKKMTPYFKKLMQRKLEIVS